MLSLKTIQVADVGLLGRQTEYAWWPTEEVERMCLKHQLHLLSFPKTIGLVNWVQDCSMEHMALRHSKGVRCTIEALGESFDNPGRQHAILLRASMFPLFHGVSRRGGTVSRCPGYDELQMFDEEVRAIVSDPIWNFLHSNVLPHGDFHPLPEFWSAYPSHQTFQQVLAALKKQVEKIKVEWTLVRICYASTNEQADQYLEAFRAGPAYLEHVKQTQLEEKNQREREQAWQAQRQQQAQAAAEKLAELKAKHARYGEWDSLPKAQKKSLIWAKPMTELAQEFGLSGTAIRKHCIREGIQVPPMGHWAKIRYQASKSHQ